ncbi:hypothetical protein FRC03_009429 [Tulasnella sp. 419]|nr:hypothetical protein FRC03_009429 [Tulasnella sp. 419]
MQTTENTPSPTNGRNLVLCFDGTSGTFDDTNTSVIRFFTLLEKSMPDRQLVYYQPGLGTYVSETLMWYPLIHKFALRLDQAVGWYLDGHIMGGYNFLMENYRPGDRIYLFGFSRGAYTARCLAGMLNKVGLLPRNNKEQINFAYNSYKDESSRGVIRSQGFKAAFSIDVVIDFMGLWDTVDSVGVLYTRRLPFTSSNNLVRIFRHALSLDERRARYQPNLWHREAPNAEAAKHDREAGSHIKNSSPDNGDGSSNEAHPNRPETDIKEVWFAGAHSDVGGGNVENIVPHSLAGPSLRWMINEVLDNTSIIFKQSLLAQLHIDPIKPSIERRDHYIPAPPTTKDRGSQDTAVSASATMPLHNPNLNGMKTQEQVNEFRDSISPDHDKLGLKPLWWILEVLPIRKTYQDRDGIWRSRWT